MSTEKQNTLKKAEPQKSPPNTTTDTDEELDNVPVMELLDELQESVDEYGLTPEERLGLESIAGLNRAEMATTLRHLKELTGVMEKALGQTTTEDTAKDLPAFEAELIRRMQHNDGVLIYDIRWFSEAGDVSIKGQQVLHEVMSPSAIADALDRFSICVDSNLMGPLRQRFITLTQNHARQMGGGSLGGLPATSKEASIAAPDKKELQHGSKGAGGLVLPQAMAEPPPSLSEGV
jgi:hypothetical protein